MDKMLVMENQADQNREELNDLQQDTSAFLKRRLILWAVRWTIGFAIIGVVVYFNPQWSWLWWAGVGFAALTPLIALISQWLIRRLVRRTEKALAELEDAMGELD